MKKILVVIDMQKDFIDGSLGTKEAVAIVPSVVKKIEGFDGDGIYVTYDSHYDNYADTLEGKKLPVMHCIEGTPGHELAAEVQKALEGRKYTSIIKNGFGTFELAEDIKKKYAGEEIEAEFIGLCTDICVVTNALIFRAAFPDAVIKVDKNCCAGVTPATHEAALSTMSCCQIDII